MHIHRLILLAAALATFSACGSKSGTFVRLSFEATPQLDVSAARRVTVNASLGGRNASAAFGDGSAQFAIPSSAVLDVRTGEGTLTLSAVLEGEGGAQLATASATTTVVRDATTEVTLRFGGANDDLGLGGDGGSDLAPEFDLLPPSDMTPPAMLVAMDTTYDYGTVVSGMTATKTLTFRNDGAVATSALSATMLTGTNANQFLITTDNCNGQTLAQNQTCSVTVQFKPTVAQPASAVITVAAPSSGMGGSATTMLSGMGASPGALTISPNTFTFPNPIDVGSNASNVFTVSNSGSSSTSALGAPIVSGDSAFTITSQNCQNAVLAPAGTCTITVRFTPSTFGTKTGTLSVSASTGGTGQSSLTATGRQSFTLTVTNNGGGTITSNPAGEINCGSTCMKTYQVTTTAPFIQLLTTPTGTGVAFDRWGGACSGTTCGVTMDQNRAVTATFNATLTLKGTLNNASVGGIDYVTPSRPSCPSGQTCVQTFDWGTQVTVRAKPGASPPSRFLAWDDDCIGTPTSSDCTVRIDRDRIARAVFDLDCTWQAGTPIFVDPGVGSDDTSHGAGPGPCAVKTVGYALNSTATKVNIGGSTDVVLGFGGEPASLFASGKQLQCMSRTFLIDASSSPGGDAIVLGGSGAGIIDCNVNGAPGAIRFASGCSNCVVSNNQVKGTMFVERNVSALAIVNNQIEGNLIFAGSDDGVINNNFFSPTLGTTIQCQTTSGTGQLNGMGNMLTGGGQVSCSLCQKCPFF